MGSSRPPKGQQPLFLKEFIKENIQLRSDDSTYLHTHTPLVIGDCVRVSVVQPIKSGHVAKNHKLPVNFFKKVMQRQPNKLQPNFTYLEVQTIFPKCGGISKCPKRERRVGC